MHATRAVGSSGRPRGEKRRRQPALWRLHPPNTLHVRTEQARGKGLSPPWSLSTPGKRAAQGPLGEGAAEVFPGGLVGFTEGFTAGSHFTGPRGTVFSGLGSAHAGAACV